MGLVKCPRCNKLFNKIRSSICPMCEPDEERDYDVIREALEKAPNLSAEQLAESTDVPIDCIMRLLDAGRISTAPDEKVRCGRCGAPAISMSKKLCEACLQKLNSEIAAAQSRIVLPKKKQVQAGTAMNIRKWLEDEEGQ